MTEKVKQPMDERWRKHNGFVTFPKPDGNGSRPESRERNMSICSWCSNRQREDCAACQAEGKYRHLVPELPASWELPPSPPPFRELVDLPAGERLAIIYLVIYYLDWQSKRE